MGDARFFTPSAPEEAHLSSTAVLRLPAEDGSVPFCEVRAVEYNVAGRRGRAVSTLTPSPALHLTLPPRWVQALASWYVAGVYDDTRGALKSTLAFRLHELGVEDVQALMCALGDSSYIVLMGPANGPRLLLPRCAEPALASLPRSFLGPSPG